MYSIKPSYIFWKEISDDNIKNENVLNTFHDAIEKGNKQIVQQILDCEDFRDEELLHALTFAETQEDILCQMLTHAAFEKAFKLYDADGNHQILELVKRIVRPSSKKKFMEIVETKIAEHDNAMFKENFNKQLENIRTHMQQALDQSLKTHAACDQLNAVRPSSFWSSQPEICQATVDMQSKLLMEIAAGKEHLKLLHAGPVPPCLDKICAKVEKTQLHFCRNEEVLQGSFDVILAPHTLESQMEEIFICTESLLNEECPQSLESHPLYRYFTMLAPEGVFIATFKSGPNIEDFANLMLRSASPKPAEARDGNETKLQVLNSAFNSVETFLRIIEVFKDAFEKEKGQTLECHLSYSLPHIPLEQFCERFVSHFPEIAEMEMNEREKFNRLISVFNVGKDIVDLNITLQISKKNHNQTKSSFKPIPFPETCQQANFIEKQSGSNEISLGQRDLSKQTQNLNCSEEAMIYIKDSDGNAQMQALTDASTKCKNFNFVELGGGRGETNAVLKAFAEADNKINLLNIEPYAPFVERYIKAHHAVGLKNVHVLEQKAQSTSVADVRAHFRGEKVDILFASHFFYFMLDDMHKALLEYEQGDPFTPLNRHPLWKFFDMLNPGSALIATIQTGIGARTLREIILGNHHLNESSTDVGDQTTSLLSCFGNLASLLRHIEVYALRHREATGETINIKMYHSVASVPLGDYVVAQDEETDGYILKALKDEQALRMFDYYGNWKQLETLATLTPQKALQMGTSALEKLGISKPTEAEIAPHREMARKKQEIFLDILPLFAISGRNMLHPNITLLITKC